jgi:thiol-disulfide isomerase/thioredoxin
MYVFTLQPMIKNLVTPIKLAVLSLCIIVCSSLAANAKDGYNITATVADCDDSVAYLCYYYGKQSAVYKADSCKFKPGPSVKIQFKSDKKLEGGIYIILFSDRGTRCEMLLRNGDDIEVAFSKKDVISTTVYKNSKENRDFIDYQNFLSSVSAQYETLGKKYEAAKTKADSAEIKKQSKALATSVDKYRRDFLRKNPNTLCGSLLGAMLEPQVPEGKQYLADKKTVDSLFPQRYYKQHYWDDFNFQDNRLIYSPIYDGKLETYFKYVVPTPDSINKAADTLLARARGAKDVFKYTLWWLTRFTENSKIMGVDESFVYIVENYYMKGDAFWMHDTMVQKYVEQAQKISPNTIGKSAPDIRLPDIDGNVTPLIDVTPNHDYTLVIFWASDCGHCKKIVPKLDSVVTAIKGKVDIKIYGVHTIKDDDLWRKQIIEKQLNDNWIHLHDPMRTGAWRKLYNVYSTPVVYLIDRSGKIVGKRLDHTNLEGLVDFLERKRKPK